MNQMNSQGVLNQYRQVGVQAGMADASPHRIIQMMLTGALDKLATAKGHMSRGEIAQKGKQISLVISIIEALRASLDHQRGGEIAQSLDALYDYMSRRLLRANQTNDTAVVDEVAQLLGTISEGWNAIPEELRYPGSGQGAAEQAR